MFESQHGILDGHNFLHIFVVRIVMFVWKDESKRKRGRGWPIFTKKEGQLNLVCILSFWRHWLQKVLNPFSGVASLKPVQDFRGAESNRNGKSGILRFFNVIWKSVRPAWTKICSNSASIVATYLHTYLVHFYSAESFGYYQKQHLIKFL